MSKYLHCSLNFRHYFELITEYSLKSDSKVMSEIQATCTVAFDIPSLVNCHDFCFEIVRKTRCWVGESPEYSNVRTMEK